jgi:ketosteroid isomerase-like protein
MRAALIALAALFGAARPEAGEATLAPALAALVEAERSFSRASGELGIREAFLAYFADDGISFEPDPAPAVERIRTWPAPQRPRLLSWDPVFADISRAGDMGYTTGPTRFEDLGPAPQPVRHGYYFSVWRRQADGAWRVAIDAGVGTPGAESPAPPLRAAAAPAPASGDAGEAAGARAAIFALEREPGADMQRFAQESRLHRSGLFPVLGREAVQADLVQRAGPTRCEPADVIVAASADLAYSYGSFARAAAKDAAAERGYYLRVWKRAPDGAWEIVAQVEQPPQ